MLNHASCMLYHAMHAMHVITFGRALVHVISCIMHVITFGRALVDFISCIMHVKKYFCVMSLLNHRRNRSSHFTFAIATSLPTEGITCFNNPQD